MSEDPESFKMGTGNRKVKNFEEQKPNHTVITPNNYYSEDKYETQSMISNVSKNPIPYGEESVAERINKINALNKKGNYVDPKLYENQRLQNTKNISYSPKNIDKKKDADEFLKSTLDNYNLMQEKLKLEQKLAELERLDELDRQNELKDNEQYNYEKQNEAYVESKINEINYGNVKNSGSNNVISKYNK